jgi:excisionase family DNA binding protein
MPAASLIELIKSSESVAPEEVPTLLGELERVRAILWAKLLRDGQHAHSETTPEDFNGRCLSPHDVAERLTLKEPYVQHLCRTGQLPGARKVGKYWRIPLASLRAWQKNGLDQTSAGGIPSAGPAQVEIRRVPQQETRVRTRRRSR